MVVWWDFEDHLRGKTAFSIVGAQNVLGALILEGGLLAGRPHWLTRSVWGLVHCIVVFCLLWRWQSNVRPLYNIVRYSLLLCFSLVVCTPSWARARIFPPSYVLKRPSPYLLT